MIAEVSRRFPDDPHGHLQELRTDPIALLQRVRDECGDVGRFRLADRDVVLVSGADVNETFFRAPDSVLDQGEAYPFMTPIFGKGVVFDASPERRQEMLKNQSLRGEQMRGHAATIEAEIRGMVERWGDTGEIDLLDFFAELTIYTTSSCLIGKSFRDELDGRFAALYHDLERGTDALAYVDAHADIDSFRRRDAAREALVALVQGIMDGRAARPVPAREDRDLLDVLVSLKDEDGSAHFSADEITGMFISMMFAGHHTSSGAAAWTMIELLRHPEVMADVLLLRIAQEEIDLVGHLVPPGTVVGVTPRVSNRIPEDFPDPERFDPGRYLDPRQEDLLNRWTWIPFGAGRHRCVGSASR